MKNALILLIAASFALSCANEDQMPLKGNVQFAVAPVAESSSGGRIMSHPFPDGAYISVSIETATGTSIYSFERIDLIQLGSGYVTVPFALIEGSYRVTDFFVMSENDEILYATPKEGSPLAGLVADPLPINFNIAADGILNLQVQVVDVDQQSPEDFGYVSFGVEVVSSDYGVSLFIGEGDELSFTSGMLELYEGNDLVYAQNLDAKVNSVNFKGDPDASYTLFVKKEGYTIKKKEYVLHELIDELNGKPLSFVLEPGFTMMIKHHEIFDNNLPFTFNLGFMGTPGSPYKIKIDWGDGAIDLIENNFRDDGLSYSPTNVHYYSTELVGKKSVINITGDLSKASYFYLVNLLPLSITDIDVTRLINLDALNLHGLFGYVAKGDTPDNIDVSRNQKLSTLIIEDSRVKYLDISNNPILTRFALADSEISNENINEVIMDLSERVGIYAYDFFSFGKDSNSDQQNLAILTPESRLKLINLRDNYGWKIYPNPQ